MLGFVFRITDTAAVNAVRPRVPSMVAGMRPGEVRTRIIDGFIVRAARTKSAVIVDVIGASSSFVSLTSVARSALGQARGLMLRSLTLQDGRSRLDAAGTENPLPSGVYSFSDDEVGFFLQGVAVTIGSPHTPISSAEYFSGHGFTRNSITASGRTIQQVGGAYRIDVVLLRCTAGSKRAPWPVLAAPTPALEYRGAGSRLPVSAAALVAVVFDGQPVGLRVETDPDSGYLRSTGGAVVSEFDAFSGVVAVSRYNGDVRLTAYSIDPKTSEGSLGWQYTFPLSEVLALDANTAGTSAIIRTSFGQPFAASARTQGVSFTLFISIRWEDSISGKAGMIHAFAAGDKTGSVGGLQLVAAYPDKVWHEAPPSVAHSGGDPRLINTATSPSGTLIRADGLASYFYHQDGRRTALALGGYFIPRMAAAGIDSALSTDPAWAGYRNKYGCGSYEEYTAMPMCAYAPGFVAVVLCPNSQFSSTNLQRFIGIVRVATGALVRVSESAIASANIFTMVSLSCLDQGVVDEDGELLAHAALLISIFQEPAVASGTPPAPTPAATGAWITYDGGGTISKVYGAATADAGLPMSAMVYMGSPLLPATIGSSRNQSTRPVKPAP